MENFLTNIDTTTDILALTHLKYGSHSWINPTSTDYLQGHIKNILSQLVFQRMAILTTIQFSHIQNYIQSLSQSIHTVTGFTLFTFPPNSIPLTPRWPTSLPHLSHFNQETMYLHVVENESNHPHPFSRAQLVSQLTKDMHVPPPFTPSPPETGADASSSIPNPYHEGLNHPAKRHHVWHLHPRTHHSLHPHLAWYRNLPFRYLSRDKNPLPPWHILSSLLNLTPSTILKALKENGLPEYLSSPALNDVINKHMRSSLLTSYRRAEAWRRRKK